MERKLSGERGWPDGEEAESRNRGKAARWRLVGDHVGWCFIVKLQDSRVERAAKALDDF